MKRANRTVYLAASVAVLMVMAAHGQGQQGGRGVQGPPLARGGGRAGGAPPPLMQTPPKPLVPNATPVRSCESLAGVALPNTTIESAVVDPSNPGVCRVTAITTHPPAADRIRIWVAIPTSNWNGRFVGTGGGGLVGGNLAGVNQPVAQRPASPIALAARVLSQPV